ncbi:DUF2198 family protein [Halalkalibacter krulwichiae]|uniref:Uncharacterized protein n=1 Tax=Halalkalibacter krulwichiae TaxID=199441 RepID=A0A1X9MK84_9BACI|nr:DUF2198 family protein [Halalkalibacter krulwichiae]ARK32061.1 hypothetical protein BkAM31D_20670 [Halalkalibacter krulwichiae]
MTDLVLALVVPFLLMVVVTRVTFSIVGACIVTLMVCWVVLPVSEQPWTVGVITLLSFVLGLIIAKKRLKKKPGM